MKPKGKLLIIGGAEDRGEFLTPEIARHNSKYKKFEILKELVTGAHKSCIEIITTASTVPAEITDV